jgi:hypothetical protein
MKSATLLRSFTLFCEQHPALRFWQALSAWSGYRIMAGIDDTFYWECRNGPTLATGADLGQEGGATSTERLERLGWALLAAAIAAAAVLAVWVWVEFTK